MAGVPPKRGEIFYWETTLTSQANTNIDQVNPTIVAGDVVVYKDGVLDGNIDTTPTPIGASAVVACTLSAAEMTADRIFVYFHDAVGAEWQDWSWEFFTVNTPSDELVDAVWDEVLTTATHDVGYSAGQRLRLLILTGAAAQGGTANSITLALAESATDHIFDENIVSIVAGLGAGQTRLIAEYVGGTRVATVDKAWDVIPNATSVYEILPFSSILLADHGLAQAGGAASITLAATASAVDNTYVGSTVYISSGTGFGQARLITAYDGGTKTATVSDAWTTIPDVTSVYKVLPVGRAIVDSINSTAMAALAATNWAYATRTLTQSAAAVTAAVSGSALTILRGDTWSASITGLGDISNYSALWFTVKRDRSDADSASILQVRLTSPAAVTDGLQRLNGAVATASQGSITVDDATAGNVTIVIDEAATAQLAGQACVYDIQVRRTTGAVNTLSEGECDVNADVTRATS